MRWASILLSITAAFAPVFPAVAQKDKPPATTAAPAAQGPLPTLNRIVPERDRNAVYTYYREEIAAGRCPRGFIKKGKACLPPAKARQVWKLDQPLANDIRGEPLPAALLGKLSPSPAGYQYLRVDNSILIVGLGTRIVTAFVADLSRL